MTETTTLFNGTTLETTTPAETAISYKDFPEYDAGQWVWKIISPILIIMGTTGNILSILVLSRKTMLRSNVSLYLIILAVSDTVVLYTGLLRHWIRIVWDKDIRKLTNVGCRIHITMVYFSLDFSVWMLVLVTLERTLTILFPHSLKFTKKVGLIAAAIIGVVLFGINSHFLYGLVEKPGSVCSSIDEDYSHFNNKIFPWIDLCAFCLVPFSILIFGNISIIYKVLQSKRKIAKVAPKHNTLAVPNAKPKIEKTSSMTIMLLVLNAVFFICTSPISIYLIGEEYWSTDDSHENAKSSLAWACVNMLQYINNSVNFFLYACSGSRFREEFICMVTGRKRAHGSVSATHRSRTEHSVIPADTNNPSNPMEMTNKPTDD